MSITGNALADFGLADRKTALLCWAERHDQIRDSLSAGPNWMYEHDAETSILAAVRPLAHPLLDDETVSDLFHTLRVCVSHKITFEQDGLAGLPDEFDDLFPGSAYDPELVEQVLDSNINHALWPLLTASTMFCTECARTKPDVLDWQPPVHGLRCAVHVVVLAGAGVGLVAS